MSRLINGASLPAMRLQASLVNTLQCVHVLGCSVGCQMCIQQCLKAMPADTWTLCVMYWLWAEAIDEEVWEGLCVMIDLLLLVVGHWISQGEFKRRWITMRRA